MQQLKTFESFSGGQTNPANLDSTAIEGAMVTGIADMLGMQMMDLNNLIQENPYLRGLFGEFSYKISKPLIQTLTEEGDI